MGGYSEYDKLEKDFRRLKVRALGVIQANIRRNIIRAHLKAQGLLENRWRNVDKKAARLIEQHDKQHVVLSRVKAHVMLRRLNTLKGPVKSKVSMVLWWDSFNYLKDRRVADALSSVVDDVLLSKDDFVVSDTEIALALNKMGYPPKTAMERAFQKNDFMEDLRCWKKQSIS